MLVGSGQRRHVKASRVCWVRIGLTIAIASTACGGARPCGPVATSAPPPAATVEVMPAIEESPALFPIFDASGKYGFIDVGGQVVIAPRFDGAERFSEGLAAVSVGGRWGFIDASGAVVIQPRWESVLPFSEGLARVIEKRDWTIENDSNYERLLCGYIDRTGRYVIPARFRLQCGSFHDGRAATEVDVLDTETFGKHGGSFGYIDASGEWAVTPSYDQGWDFHEGLALAARLLPDTTYSRTFIDPAGVPFQIPAGWEPASWVGFSEGRAVVREPATGRWGAIDRKGALVFAIDADALEPFAGGLAVIRRGDRFGYVGLAGDVRIAPVFACAEPFSDGLGRVCKVDTRDELYLDATGKVVLEGGIGGPRGPFLDGLQYRALIIRTISEQPSFRNVYGYQNKQGKLVWVSPGAERFDATFWREHYVGPPRAAGSGP